jgi:ketosteroid isomerase-like protein
VADSRGETIRAIYRCFSEHRLEPLDHLIPADGALIQDPKFPDARTWRGPEGVRKWFSQIAAQFGTVQIEPIHLQEDGDHALATVEIDVQGRTSGAAAKQRMAHVWTFRGERLATCRFFLDVDEGRARYDELRASTTDVAT